MKLLKNSGYKEDKIALKNVNTIFPPPQKKKTNLKEIGNNVI